MGAGLVIAAVALAAALAAAVMPWSVGLSLQAEGAEDGRWALAGGVELFRCAAAFAQARGTPLVLELRAFGRRLLRRTHPSGALARAPAKKPAPAAPPEPLRARYDRLARWLDPLDLLLFLAGERRRLAVRDLEGSVCLGLHDVALAGQLAGVLAVLGALGSPFGRLRHEIDWSGREHLEASVSFSLRFSPALLVLDTARYLARSIRVRKPPSPSPA